MLEADLRDSKVSFAKGNKLPYERDATIAGLFRTQAGRTPKAIALQCGSAEWTYEQLDRWSDVMASWLAGHGVVRHARVGLLADRSPAAVAAMLAVAKLGAAFVPFDTQYPLNLLRDLVSDASPLVMVSTRDAWRAGAINFRGPVLMLDEVGTDPAGNVAPSSLATGAGTDPAYVMYTSGSTGRQKGVVVPHRAIARLVRNTDFAELGPDEVFLQLAPISFDASTLEIWGALLNGGRLAFLEEKTPSLSQIAEAIRKFRVTTLWLTAGLFHLMVDRHIEAFAPLRQLLAGGDVLSPAHVGRVMDAHPHLRVINGYGPTENTTFTCCHTVPRPFAGGALPIGRPIANTHVVILDDALNPVPAGEVGQLCAGGDGVALGYLNQPEQTAAKFIADPFSDEPDGRLYLTGDLAKLLPDGTIAFLGRGDTQVKIDGKRIEMEEVDAAIRKLAGVDDVTVIAREDVPGQKRLAAYVVLAAAGAPSLGALRDQLRDLLPAFMVPADFVELDALPLTINGKVDRRALPAPLRAVGQSATSTERVAAGTEDTVARVWRDVLAMPAISPQDNFFDLGGTSLKAMAVHERLQAATGKAIALTDLFQFPTIRALAAHLDAADGGPARQSGLDARVAARAQAAQRMRQLRGA